MPQAAHADIYAREAAPAQGGGERGRHEWADAAFDGNAEKAQHDEEGEQHAAERTDQGHDCFTFFHLVSNAGGRVSRRAPVKKFKDGGMGRENPVMEDLKGSGSPPVKLGGEIQVEEKET